MCLSRVYLTWKSIPPSVNFISEYKWLCKLQNTHMCLSFHPSRFLNLLILVSALALASCGGGATTAGSGGSGIGGTGITTVTGNVVEVIATAPEQEQASLGGRMIARAVRWVAAPVSAAATDLAGIRVVGGGQITNTDENGDFVLEDVSPSESFILTFELADDSTINLPIGTVPAGSLVQVSDIVINADEGFANPGDIDIEENPGSGPGNVNNPGNSQNASDNNRAGNASANSNENAADQAATASDNNRATGASSGANSNAGGNK